MVRRSMRFVVVFALWGGSLCGEWLPVSARERVAGPGVVLPPDIRPPVVPFVPGKGVAMSPLVQARSQGLGTDLAPGLAQVLAQNPGLAKRPSVADGASEVAVGRGGRDVVAAGGAPMVVGAVLAESKSAVAKRSPRVPETVRVAVVGDVRAQAAGLGVFGFSVKETGVGGSGRAAVRVAMDYSQFRYAYGVERQVR